MDLSTEDLVKLYKEELSTPELIELPADFSSEVGRLLGRLNSELQKSEDLERELVKEELKEVTALLERFCRIRTMKAMIKLVTRGIPEEVANKERNYYLEIKKLIDEVQGIYLKPVEGAEAARITVAEEVPKTMVIVLADLGEKLLGIDGKTYGPLRAGDIVNLPTANAEILIKHGMAKKIGSEKTP